MKVLGNLENYDIPSGFRLTPEQEIKFAADLKEIVEHLIPIRDSKLKTRTYFNQCLRYTSNVKDLNFPDDSHDPNEPFDESPFPYPGYEVEYTWNSDLLQPALLDILEVDKYSFGYVINLIYQDLEHRNTYYCGNYIPDVLVKFCLEFDINEIRSKAKAIENLTDRISYLNKVNTDFRIHDHLPEEYEGMIAPPVGRGIQALLDEAQKELELAKVRATLKDCPGKSGKGTKDTGKSRRCRFDASRGMLYDFAVSQKEEFKPLAVILTDKWDISASQNIKAFTQFIDRYFETCYDDDGGLQQNEATFKYTPKLLVSLMDSYAAGLRANPKNTDHDIMKLLFKWIRQTHKIIDKAQENHPMIHSDDLPWIDEGKSDSVSTWGFKKILLSSIYGYLPYVLDDYVPPHPDSLSSVIPYNMWKNDFEELKSKYSNKFGLEREKRAVVRVSDNIELFKDVLIDNCLRFCYQMSIESIAGSISDVEESEHKTITNIFYPLFRDYISRISAVSGNKEDIDAALLCWISDLERLIHRLYEEEHQSIENKNSDKSAAFWNCHYFFYDICCRIITELALVYFDDFEKMDLIPAENNTLSALGSEKEHTAAICEDNSESALKHSRTIAYDKLFNKWNGKAFKNVTLEDFTRALDEADFSDMLQMAIGAGPKTGYIGALKYIMKNLRNYLGDRWYSLACESINETIGKMDKLNKNTDKIKSIDLRHLEECFD